MLAYCAATKSLLGHASHSADRRGVRPAAPQGATVFNSLFKRLASLRSMLLQSQRAEPPCLTAGGGSTARRTWLVQQSPL